MLVLPFSVLFVLGEVVC